MLGCCKHLADLLLLADVVPLKKFLLKPVRVMNTWNRVWNLVGMQREEEGEVEGQEEGRGGEEGGREEGTKDSRGVRWKRGREEEKERERE